jgi:hypothetical protein
MAALVGFSEAEVFLVRGPHDSRREEQIDPHRAADPHLRNVPSACSSANSPGGRFVPRMGHVPSALAHRIGTPICHAGRRPWFACVRSRMLRSPPPAIAGPGRAPARGTLRRSRVSAEPLRVPFRLRIAWPSHRLRAARSGRERRKCCDYRAPSGWPCWRQAAISPAMLGELCRASAARAFCVPVTASVRPGLAQRMEGPQGSSRG